MFICPSVLKNTFNKLPSINLDNKTVYVAENLSDQTFQGLLKKIAEKYRLEMDAFSICEETKSCIENGCERDETRCEIFYFMIYADYEVIDRCSLGELLNGVLLEE